MIAFVRGSIQLVYEGGVILDHNGLGFDIKTSGLTISSLPGIGQEVTLHTFLYVREDVMDLYGFLSREELQVFQLLIGVNGIGPKAALAILSTLSVEQLRYAVLSDDTKAIAKAPGIGPKGAQRLIIELKDKLKLEDMFPDFEPTASVVSGSEGSNIGETVMALVSLGYSNSDAMKAVRAVPDAEAMNTEQLLKEALKKVMTL
jgi:Holliday junction DNA helicase RuvA